MIGNGRCCSFFFFQDPAPTEIYTLSLHDALPIYRRSRPRRRGPRPPRRRARCPSARSSARCCSPVSRTRRRSEEHTSELQSRRDLVCRLLLEKKKETGQLKSTNPPSLSRTTWSAP